MNVFFNNRGKRTICILLISGILLRIGMWLVYEPIFYPDSYEYIDTALSFEKLNFDNYDGARTPIYPLMILLAGLNYKIIWFVQSALGIGISLMLFVMAKRHTHNDFLSLLVGASYSLNLIQVFFEATILTETLSTFLLVSSVFLVTQIRYERKKNVARFILLGIVVSLTGLTRPLFLYLGPLYFLFLVSDSSDAPHKSHKMNRVISFVIPWIIIIFSWCLFNKITVDYFGPTTLLGYNLTRHSGAFIELVPDEYAEIRDVFIKYRQMFIEETGAPSQMIWIPSREILEKTGLTFGELSRQLTCMSITLFIQHPLLYLRSVSQSWMRFWLIPTCYWEPKRIEDFFLVSSFSVILSVESILLLFANFLFLTVSCYCLLRFFIYIRSVVICKQSFAEEWTLLIICIVISASIIQAFLEFGENARYAIPFQPLMTYVALTVGWRFVGEAVRKIQMR